MVKNHKQIKQFSFNATPRRKSVTGFTLIELLIVIGILVVLGTVVVLTLNPAQIFKESRDSRRVTDLQTLRDALKIAESLKLDTSVATDVVYASIPDTDCAGLPENTPSYTCNAATGADLKNIDGTGWIPIDFRGLSSAGTGLPTLPIDPINTVSSGLFYTYQKGSFLLSAQMESQKFQTDIGCVYIQGSGDPNLTAPDHGVECTGGGGGGGGGITSGLIAYWKLDGNYNDSSGNRNNLSIGEGSISFESGKKNEAAVFDGGSYLTSASSLDLTGASPRTFTAWVKTTGTPAYAGIVDTSAHLQQNQIDFGLTHSGEPWSCGTGTLSFISGISNICTSFAVNDGSWHFVAVTYDGTTITLYGDNQGVVGSVEGALNTSDTPINVGYKNAWFAEGTYYFTGDIDEVRIYDHALTQTDVCTQYHADGGLGSCSLD